jgi:hypothetical protein
MSFNSKWFILDIYWIPTSGKPNPKPNPIGFRAPNPKTVGEKSFMNPNPWDSKPADIRPKTVLLPSLSMVLMFGSWQPIIRLGGWCMQSHANHNLPPPHGAAPAPAPAWLSTGATWCRCNVVYAVNEEDTRQERRCCTVSCGIRPLRRFLSAAALRPLRWFPSPARTPIRCSA